MSARKSERIMNLTICLLLARRFLPREHLRRAVEGYAGLSDAAFERTFERDKEDLRALGVPIETGSDDPLFPDEVGYRIRRTDFELPPLEFDAAERAAIGIATGVWEQTRLADSTVQAVAKLRAAGIDPDVGRVAAFVPSVDAPEPAFEALWEATIGRRRVRFRYRGVDRTVEPWTLSYRRGAWFLIGHDLTRGEGRSFKLARIEGPPVVEAVRGGYEVPGADVLAAHVASLEPAAPSREALVALADGAAHALRRRSRPAEDVADAPPAPPGFSLHLLPYADADAVVGELAAAGTDVEVVGPPALRAALVAHLEGVAARWR